MRKILHNPGHHVECVRDGRAAVEACSGERFDLVLTDVQMPEMNGIDATLEIRRRERSSGGRVAIIALTAHAMAGDRDRCLEAGMVGYVSKPCRVASLREEIERVGGGAGELRATGGRHIPGE